MAKQKNIIAPNREDAPAEVVQFRHASNGFVAALPRQVAETMQARGQGEIVEADK